ncbi:MAG: hypothetical protein LUE31_01315 [Lachnospiraceae bacterium]|nr:hypothetical protein [Lachnospiraceae bacterium]
MGFAAEAGTDSEEETVIESEVSTDGEASDSNEDIGSGTDAEISGTGSGYLDGYIGPELGETEYTAADDGEEVVTVYEDADITPFADLSAVEIEVTSTDSINVVGSSADISVEEYSSVSLSDSLSGLGTEDEPYLIYTEDELSQIAAEPITNASSAYYQLQNDITITTETLNPIGSISGFTGVFDGNGYTITGSATFESTGMSGLFATNSGTIKNLNVNLTIGETATTAGLLVGVNSGLISGCSSTGSITSTSSVNVGGLVGQNNGTITNCSSSAAVSSTGNAGGLVGYLGSSGAVSGSCATGGVTASEYAGGLIGYSYYSTDSGSITSTTTSYATGTVSGKYAGGLIGYLYTYRPGYTNDSIVNTVKYCYSQGVVTGTTNVGGLIGYVKAGRYHSSYPYPEINILYCYSTGVINEGSGGGLAGYISDRDYIHTRYCYYNQVNEGNKVGFSSSLSRMKTSALYYGWNFDNYWNISSSSVYPYLDIRGTEASVEITGAGTTGNPYIIENEDQLIALVNGSLSRTLNYKLGSDIAVTARHWTPIGGNGTTSFTGTFDGDGYTISGLKLSNSYYENIGFFGYNAGTIKNLNLDVTFEGVYRVGGLAAYNTGTIENCTVSGTITNVESEGNHSGGLVGSNSGGSVTGSSSTATVTAEYGSAGGLSGYNSGAISDSYSTSVTTSTESNAGGLVGYNSNGTIESSYATGSITAGNYAGGLIGYSYYSVDSGKITSTTTSYATGTVSGKYAGGLIGYLYTYRPGYTNDSITNTVKYSYARGSVTGSTYGGGLIGYTKSGRYHSSYPYPELNILYCYASGLVNSGNGSGLIGDISSRIYIYVRYSYYLRSNSGNKIGFNATASNLKKAATYYGWDFDNIWNISTSSVYPYIDIRGTYAGIEIEGFGDDDDPYIIENEEQLIAIVNGEIGPSTKAYYELANDITVTASHWTPIGGNGTNDFNGVFDGVGHIISGIKLTNSHYENIGFFGSNTGTIKNLNLDVTFEGVYNVGGLAGWNSGTIENCTVTGTITNVDSEGNASGGLVGVSNSGSITDSSSSASVTAEYGTTGGLVGYNYEGAIKDSYASGAVTSTNYYA